MNKFIIALFFSVLPAIFLVSEDAAGWGEGTVTLQENIGSKLLSDSVQIKIKGEANFSLSPGFPQFKISYLPATSEKSDILADLEFQAGCPYEWYVSNAQITSTPDYIRRVQYTSISNEQLEILHVPNFKIIKSASLLENCLNRLNQGRETTFRVRRPITIDITCDNSDTNDSILENHETSKSYSDEFDILMEVTCEDGLYPSTTASPAPQYSCPQVPKAINSLYWKNYRLVVKGTPYRKVTTSKVLDNPACIRINSGDMVSNMGVVIESWD